MASTTWHQFAEAASGRAAAMESSSEAVTIRERNVRCTVCAPSWALYWLLVTAKQGLPGLRPNLTIVEETGLLLIIPYDRGELGTEDIGHRNILEVPRREL